MQDLRDMGELDLPSNLRLIISKLPDKMEREMRIKACDILERTQRRARLDDLVVYIERQLNYCKIHSLVTFLILSK